MYAQKQQRLGVCHFQILTLVVLIFNEKASGLDFDFECDWLALATLCKSKSYSDIDRLGETVHYIVSCLANSVKRFCQEPITKEAFIDMTGTKKLIRFIVDADKWKETTYFRTAVVDGV